MSEEEITDLYIVWWLTSDLSSELMVLRLGLSYLVIVVLLGIKESATVSAIRSEGEPPSTLSLLTGKVYLASSLLITS